MLVDILGILNVLSCTISVQCDQNIATFLDMTAVHGGSPKVWHSYIQRYLQLILESTFSMFNGTYILQWSSFQMFTESIRNFAHNLLLYSKFSPRFKWHIHKILPEQSLTRIAEYMTLVRKISGEIFVKTNSFGVHSVDFVIAKFLFYLDPRLGLNVTLNELYLSSGREDCMSGNLTIQTDKCNLHFCGFHSMTQAYPQGNKVSIALHWFKSITYRLNWSFVVLDSNRLYSSHQIIQTLRLIHTNIVNLKTELVSCLI